MKPATPRLGASVLILEPDFLLRRTVVGVIRDMQLAEIHEATQADLASRLLMSRRFDALLFALDDEGAAIELLLSLRRGGTLAPADTPVAVTAAACDASLALRLKELKVRRVLLKPFKVKSVIETVSGLCTETVASA
jgi:DNA-binding NarL/FixJ family response regulator